MSDVALIGVGMLGAAMGRHLLEEGYSLTAWNRTRRKAQVLADQGAVVVESVREAVESSPVILICVVDHVRTLELLDDPEIRRALAGRLILQTSSSVPDQIRELDLFAKAVGAELIEAPISHRPEEIGTATGFICACGPSAAYGRVEGVLNVLTQNLVYVGEEIGQASALFGLVNVLILGGLVSLANALGMARSEGIPLAQASLALSHARNILMDIIPLELQRLAEDEAEPSETSVDIWLAVTRNIRPYFEGRGFDVSLWKLLEGTLEEGTKAGLGDRDVAALGELIGSRSSAET